MSCHDREIIPYFPGKAMMQPTIQPHDDNSAGHLRIDGVEYDVSNLLAEPIQEDVPQRIYPTPRRRSRYQKSHSSRSLRKSRESKFPFDRSMSFHHGKPTKIPDTPKQRMLKKAPPSPATEISSTTGHDEYSTRGPAQAAHTESVPIHRVEDTDYPEQSRKEEEHQPEDEPLPNPNHLTVEIAPGVHEVLRGSVETTRAWKRGDIVQLRCVVCTQDISCISDAAFILCPTCRVISPVPNGEWGVGLGFIE